MLVGTVFRNRSKTNPTCTETPDWSLSQTGILIERGQAGNNNTVHVMTDLNHSSTSKNARIDVDVRSDIVASIEVVMVVAAYIVLAMLTAMASHIV